jgi:hypothetical protein
MELVIARSYESNDYCIQLAKELGYRNLGEHFHPEIVSRKSWRHQYTTMLQDVNCVVKITPAQLHGHIGKLLDVADNVHFFARQDFAKK